MTDLASVSDDELLASLPRGVRNNNPLNLKTRGTKGQDGAFAVYGSMDEGMAAADRNLAGYGSRHGINTLSGVINRWAPPGVDNNSTARYISHVSQRTGIDPNARIDLANADTRKALLGAMGEYENGTPVTRSDLSGVSDEELLASLKGQMPAAQPKPKAPPGAPLPKPKPATAAPPRAPARPNGPTIAQDAWSGLTQPFTDFAKFVAEDYRKQATQKAPASIGEFATGIVDDAKRFGNYAGGVMGMFAAPVQAVVRPTARAVNRTGFTPYENDKLTFQGGKPVIVPGKPITDPNAKQAFTEGALNTAFSAARPAPVKAPAPAKAPTLAELEKANKAKWAEVDRSGVRFPKAEVKAAAADIKQIVKDADPALYPEAAKVAAKVNRLAKRPDGLTPGQANRLRSQTGEKLLAPGSTEGSVGAEIKARIDQLIDTGNEPALAEARDLYSRVKKYKEVSDRVDDAELARTTAGTGGNGNAVRQQFKPLIKKKGKQQLINATPDEKAAIRKIARGTPVQNALRVLTAFDPSAGKMQAFVSGGMGVATGLKSLALAPVGVAAKLAERAIEARNIEKLLDLIATGGVAPRPVYAPPAPVPKLTSPRGLIGSEALLTAPTTLLAPPREKPKAKRKPS